MATTEWVTAEGYGGYKLVGALYAVYGVLKLASALTGTPLFHIEEADMTVTTSCNAEGDP